jgi:hypothetical protein
VSSTGPISLNWTPRPRISYEIGKPEICLLASLVSPAVPAELCLSVIRSKLPNSVRKRLKRNSEKIQEKQGVDDDDVATDVLIFTKR